MTNDEVMAALDEFPHWEAYKHAGLEECDRYTVRVARRQFRYNELTHYDHGATGPSFLEAATKALGAAARKESV